MIQQRAQKADRPILRYHGGKWMLAPWIISHFPMHRHYVEPFGGAASVLLRKPPSVSECYNDIDGDIVNVLRVLRDSRKAAKLRRLCVLTAFSRVEFLAAYELSEDPIERARRTIVRSFMGFGSAATQRQHVTGFRAQSRKSGTSPSLDWKHWPDEIPTFVERLRGVCIESRPAEEVILGNDGIDVLFYVDPPYVHSTRGNAGGVRQKYAAEMTDQDHRALAQVLRGLAGMVVLSGYPCDLYDRDLFSDWRRIERPSLADGARARTEVLWLNPAASERLPLQSRIHGVA